MRHFINKVIGNSLFKPRVVVSVPAMHTDVEKRTIVSVMIHAGARSVCLVEEPLCAAFGAGIDPMQPSGAFVIDLGGGTVDMAVISQGAMSQSESLKVGGNDLDAEIVKFLREAHNVAVGLRTAEEIKRTVACALPERGRCNHLCEGTGPAYRFASGGGDQRQRSVFGAATVF